MKILEALDDVRPDTAVSLWLQDQAKNGIEGLPAEVINAYRADRFLSEVNMGGFSGFFTWEFEDAAATEGSLGAIGLESSVAALRSAIQLLPGGCLPSSREGLEPALEEVTSDEGRRAQMTALDESVMNASQEIERATHAYVRANLGVFQALEG